MRAKLDALRRHVTGASGVTALAETVERHRQRLDYQNTRLDSQRRRVDKQAASIKALRARLRHQAELIKEQKRTIAGLRSEVQPLTRADRLREVDVGRALEQLGALEVRLGRLEEQVSDGDFASDETSRAEARSLVDTVRREHDQARVRFQVISSYEERMRRLEAAVVQMYEGDLRQTL
jgi:hypothetical protein